jgi:hypothetical protein
MRGLKDDDVTGHEVIFIASGSSAGYLLINANGDNAISGAHEFAVVLEFKIFTADFAFTDIAFV